MRGRWSRRWSWRRRRRRRATADSQAGDNVGVRDVLAVTSRSEMRLRRIAKLWPLLRQVLRGLVEVAITSVVKDACLQTAAVSVFDRRKGPPLATITLAPIL